MASKLYNRKFSLVGCGTHLTAHKDNIVKKITDCLEPRQDDRILEIGCNRGKLVKQLRLHHSSVIGVDINLAAIRSSRVGGLLAMDAEELGFGTAKFSKIVLSHTAEHVGDLQRSFHEMSRVLADGGRVVLIYPFEIIRGITALRSAWASYRDLRKARALHQNKLSPQKVKKMIRGTQLCYVKSGLFWGNSIDYYSVLMKG